MKRKTQTPAPRTIALSPADAQALREQQRAMERTRVAAACAQSAQAAAALAARDLFERLAQTYEFDANKSWAYDDRTGTLREQSGE